MEVNRQRFAGLLKDLYRQLSRQEPLAVENPASPTRQLRALLLEPLQEALEAQQIETLLIAADQGLQAVPSQPSTTEVITSATAIPLG